MFGGRRGLVAVLAAGSVVLGAAQASGIEATMSNVAEPGPHLLAAGPDNSGTTVRTSVTDSGGQGTSDHVYGPALSGNGRYQIFYTRNDLQPGSPATEGGTATSIYVRDLKDGHTVLLSLGTSASLPASGPVASDGSPLVQYLGEGSNIPADASSPSISDDGRFFSYVTEATNVVPSASGSFAADTLVVCDRDPTQAKDADGNWILDQPGSTPNVPGNVCVAASSNVYNAFPGIDLSQTPRLSGDGTWVYWVERTAVGASRLRRAQVVANGTLQQPASTQIVTTNGVSTSADVCAPDVVIQFAGGAGVHSAALATTYGVQTVGNPTPNVDGSRVAVTVGFAGKGCTGVAIVNAAAGTGVRVDQVAGGSSFLGDFDFDTARVSFYQPSIIDDGDEVAFTYNHTDPPPPIPPGFAAGPKQRPAQSALLATTPIHQGYLASVGFNNAVTSQIVAVDKNGSPVTSSAIGISGDGRYVAFSTSDTGAYDGQGDSGEQVVARDLVTQVNALATPGVACASPPCTAGTAGSITLDRIGSRIGFDSDSADVVAGDTNNKSDSFVRTWNPKITDTTSSLGDVAVGDSTVFSVDVQVTGFGPVLFGQPTVTPGGDFNVEATTCVRSGPTPDPFHLQQTCDVSLRFAPTGSTGPRTATVSIPAPTPDGTATNVDTVTANVVDSTIKNAAGDTVRTSVTNGGAEAKAGGDQAMISGNGRWQVFVSSDELAGRAPVDPAKSGSIVYVRDLAAPMHTIQISLHTDVTGTTAADAATHPVAPNVKQPIGASPNGDSYEPSISSDGRFVSFVTRATDVVPIADLAGDGNFFVVVVCDRDPSGAKVNGQPVLDRNQPGTSVPDYACFAVQSGRDFPNALSADDSSRPQLAGNGTRIAWVESDSGDADRVRVATLSTPGGTLHAPTGAAYVPSSLDQPFRLSANRDPGDAGKSQFFPTLTEDGGAVVFVVGTKCSFGSCAAIATGETTISSGQTTRFDLSDDQNTFVGDGGGYFDPPSVSDDGTRVAFAFRDQSNDAPTRVWVVTNQVSGGSSTLLSRMVSRDNRGRPGIGSQPALSGDGRYVAFRTGSANMHNGVDPANGSCYTGNVQSRVNCQIVARDLVHDERMLRQDPTAWTPSELVTTSLSTTCVTSLPPGRKCASTAEATADYPAQTSDSSGPTLDETGSEVSFDSDANDLVAGDTNFGDGEGGPYPVTDTFVRTWRPQLTVPIMDFGSVKLGSSKTKTFQIIVTGFGGVPADFGPISLGTSSVSGLNAADFTIVSTTCTGQTLHEGPASVDPSVTAPESCSFTLRFTPHAPGTRSASLATRVGKNGYPRTDPASNISYDPAILRALTGFGATSVVTVNPSTIDFGNRRAKDPLTKTTTVTNTGSTDLVISGVVVNDTTVPGARNDYTVNFANCLPQVAPGASCTIAVTFSGSRVGVRNAVLVITSNASGGTTSVGLLARVLKPKIDANPAVSVVRRVITVTGTNFAPNHFVEVGFDNDVQDTVKTDAHGAFSLTMIVLPNGRMGPRTLFGHSVGLSKTIRGEFDFLVVLGTSDPGNGQITRDS